MLTFLDLLVVVFLVLAVTGLLALCLLFLSKNVRVKKVCFYLVVALSIYACSIGIRIGWPLFLEKAIAAIVLGAVSVAAVVLERISKGDEKKFKIARILAAVSLVLGIVNAFS